MKQLNVILITFLCAILWSCTPDDPPTPETAILKYELVGTLQDGYAVEYTDPLGNTVGTGAAAVYGGWTKTFTITKTGRCYSIRAGGGFQAGVTTVNIYINDQLVASKTCNCFYSLSIPVSTCY